MTQTNQTKTYQVLDYRIPELQHKVDKINRRAVKLGCQPIELHIGEPYDVKTRFDGKDVILRKRDVEVLGEPPRVDGWTLAAKLMHVDGMVIIANVPGETVPVELRDVEPGRCDHCRTHRQRTDTFALHDTNSKWQVVGRNCLADFLGGHDPRRAAAECQYMIDVAGLLEEEEGFHGSREAVRLDPIDVLSRTIVAIREHGWLSRTAARDSDMPCEATADEVQRDYFAIGKTRDGEDCADWLRRRVEDKDRTEAEQAWQWAATAGEGTDSDYLYNVRTVASMTSVPVKLLGITCSILVSYRRHIEREVERRRAQAASNHFGVVKKREVFELTVVGCRVIEGDYGTVSVYRFIEGEGNQATWFSSNDPDLEIGQTYKVKATVKKHNEYKGIAQTVLTRCAIQ
jgi:hypothetical protein